MSIPASPGLQMVTTGSFQENCWLVWDHQSREAAVVDPGEGTAEILAAIAERELDVQAIWLTHAHIDHVLGLEVIRAATGAPVWLHPADRRWYDALPEQARMFGLDRVAPLAPPDHDFADGDTMSLGPWRFGVHHAPGHAPGHVALIGHGIAISGDLLFQDSIGRTDLAEGNTATLMASLDRVLMSLPDETRVLPGHGPETTVGRERRMNPFLRRR